MTASGRSPHGRAARAGRRRPSLESIVSFGLACLSAVVVWLSLASVALAASPNPSPDTGGDPRSSGQGPGLVGDPAFALLAVAAIGVASVLFTLAYVRLTAHRHE